VHNIYLGQPIKKIGFWFFVMANLRKIAGIKQPKQRKKHKKKTTRKTKTKIDDRLDRIKSGIESSKRG
jgi:hypothetical protein